MLDETGHRNHRLRRFLRIRVLWKVGVLTLVVGAVAYFLLRGGEIMDTGGTTFVVRRGTLPITVVEGGSAASEEPHEVKCEVKAYRQGVKILSIVEEGYRVTKEDIDNKKVLVQLDSAEIEERIMQQEIEYQSTRAAFSKAQQDYEIQVKQNETDIQAAEREARFKAMDLQKYLGETVANDRIEELLRRRATEEAGKAAQDAEKAAREAAKKLEEANTALAEARANEEKRRAARTAEQAAAEDGDTKGEEETSSGTDASGGIALLLKEAQADSQKLTQLFQELESDPGKMMDIMKEAQKTPGLMANLIAKAKENPETNKKLESLMAKAGGKMPKGMMPEGRMKGGMGPPGNGAKQGVDELTKAAEDAAKVAEEATRLAQETAKAFEEAVKDAGADVQESEGNISLFEPVFEPIDFPGLANDPRLGGEAEQKRKSLQTDIMQSEDLLMTAKKKLTGTQSLFDHEFATEMELLQDTMAVKSGEISLEAKKTSEDLFFRYEFPKQAEEAYSQYDEALTKYDRVTKEAETKLLNAEVNLGSAEARFKVQEKARKDNQDQLEKCTIYAEYEGLIVYGGDRDRRSYGGEPVREGATIREQQTILTIPDITQMSINVNIHESAIQKIKKGQKAKIRVEAVPDEELVGEVTKVSVLPDSENRWLNPDLKVYETTVSVDGVYEWLKPGMTAEVEIAIDELHDVLYVPLQAVSSYQGERACYLANSERRPVETGEFNDNYIEIKSGLEGGDRVLLRPPKSEDDGKEEDSVEQPEESTQVDTDSSPA